MTFSASRSLCSTKAQTSTGRSWVLFAPCWRTFWFLAVFYRSWKASYTAASRVKALRHFSSTGTRLGGSRFSSIHSWSAQELWRHSIRKLDVSGWCATTCIQLPSKRIKLRSQWGPAQRSSGVKWSSTGNWGLEASILATSSTSVFKTLMAICSFKESPRSCLISTTWLLSLCRALRSTRKKSVQMLTQLLLTWAA